MRHDVSVLRDAGDRPGLPVACMLCGTQVESVPLTWTVQSSDRGVEHLCEKCTRDNARQIESSLPAEWW
jgi:hypothetical protein